MTIKEPDGTIRTVHPAVYQLTKRVGFPKPAGFFAEILAAHKDGRISSDELVLGTITQLELLDGS